MILLVPSSPTKARPSKVSVVPPSGTALAVVSVVNVNIVSGLPLAFVEVKAHTPGVGSKPPPEIVPVPLIFKKVWVRGEGVTVEPAFKSNENPPTAHRSGVALTKTQGVAKVTELPNATPEKSPVARVTAAPVQVLTCEAVAKSVVS